MNRIFKITFSQLMKIGIIFVLIGIVIGAIPAVMLINSSSSYDMSYNFMNYIIFIAVAPTIAILCFKFLNKRSSSDYYHSLATTRKALYFGRLLAGIVWLTLNTLATFISAIVAYKILTPNMIIDYLLITKLFIAIYICAILVFGAVSLAMSLTTGFLYNIFCSVIILFFARILSEFTIHIITNLNYSLVSYDNIAGIFNRKYNMLWGLFSNTGGLDNILWKIQLNRTSAYIYTIVLAIIFILLGMIAFSKRKSEIAQAKNPKVIENVMKISFAVISFIIYVYIRILYNGQHTIQALDLALGITLSILIIIVWDYFITKNKHILSSIVAIGICVLSIVFIEYSSNKIASFKPSSENIDYIEISIEEGMIGHSYYSRIFADRIKTENRNTIQFFCDNYENQECDNVWNGSNDPEAMLYVTFVDGLNRTTVKRELHITDEVVDVFYNDKNINNAIFSTLPAPLVINDNIMETATTEQKNEVTDLYSVFKKDVEKYKPKEYVAAALGKSFTNGSFFVFGGMELVTFPIIQSMPDSYELSFKKSNVQALKKNYEKSDLKFVSICLDDFTEYKLLKIDNLEKTQAGQDFISMLYTKYKNQESPKADQSGVLVKLTFDVAYFYYVKLDNIPQEILDAN